MSTSTSSPPPPACGGPPASGDLSASSSCSNEPQTGITESILQNQTQIYRKDTDKFQSTSQTNNTNAKKFFSKYITLKVRDNPLKRIPPTIREKGLQAILGKDRVIECTPHNNFYLIKVANEKDAELLLKQDKLSITPSESISVVFEPHNQLSQSKGVLFDRMNELEDLTTDEITESLKDQGVVRTDRLPPRAANPNNRWKPGTTYFLTFLSDQLPQSVRVGCDSFRISEYTPRPRMCRKCLRYGHGTNNCRGKEKCLYCHKEDHDADSCQTKNAPEPCYHCKSPEHTAGNPECSEYAYQKQIALVMQQDKLLFWQAKQEVDKTWIKPETTPTQTFAQATASTSETEKENERLNTKVAELSETVDNLRSSMHEMRLTLSNLCLANAELKKQAEDAVAGDQQRTVMLKKANAKITELKEEITRLKSTSKNQQTLQQRNTNRPSPQVATPTAKKDKTSAGDSIVKKGSLAKTESTAAPPTNGGSKEDLNKKRSANELSPNAAGSRNASKRSTIQREGKTLHTQETAQVVNSALDTALSYDSDQSITEDDLMDHNGSQDALDDTLTDQSNK